MPSGPSRRDADTAEALNGVRARGGLGALPGLVREHPRRYGAYLAHLGIVLMVVGLTALLLAITQIGQGAAWSDPALLGLFALAALALLGATPLFIGMTSFLLPSTLVVTTPAQAIILASIVEKETGRADERPAADAPAQRAAADKQLDADRDKQLGDSPPAVQALEYTKQLDKVLADKTTLTHLLTHHVVPSRLAPAALAGTHPTLNSDSVKVTGTTPDFDVAGAKVLCGNVQTANGNLPISAQSGA